jgi:hypothetical protein
MLPSPPSLDGYIDWIRAIMGINENILSDTSIYIEMSYDISLEVVNRYLDIASPGIYTIAVYNLAGDYLINIAQDNDPSSCGCEPNPDPTFWADLRAKFQINSFIPGLVDTAADQGTSAGIKLLASMEGLTIADLQTLKTPYGRVYMGIAQSIGSMWGVS